MILLAINWAKVSMQAGQLFLALAILILLHEFGHYITARWFKCRVDKFYLFFDPWFALFKKKIGDTEYGIGWLPLGGYCKIAGMIDESMDKEQIKAEPKPYEFRSKPPWQRLIILLGGIIMNVLTAFLIYAFVLMKWGEKQTPMSSLKYGIWTTDSLMNEAGLQNGDKIVTVNGDTVDFLENLNAKIFVSRAITIERNGELKTFNIREDLVGELINRKKRHGQLLYARLPAYVGKYDVKAHDDTFPGYRAGLREMDRIVAIDSTPIQFYDEMSSVLRDHKNQPVRLTVQRGGGTLNLTANVNSEGKIGIPILDEEQYARLGVFEYDKKKYGFFEAFPAGIRKAGEKLSFYIDQFKLILNPKTGAAKGLGGFKAIASVFPDYWSWEAFWNITAFLSIVLAFMNLLPIPALDGGHVMFTLYEMITRHRPSEKFLEYAQMVGMILLLGLMLYANGNDWFGWGR